MKASLLKSIHILVLCALAIFCASQMPLEAQTTANWTGGGGDGEWNTGLNWDQGAPPADVTTNAVIGVGNTVNYSTPMTAGSFGSLTLNGVLNINAAGFVVGAAGNAAVSILGSTGRLFVNNGGAVSVTNGGVSLTGNLGAGTVASGGSLTMTGTLAAGGSTTGVFTNNGGMLAASAISVNPNNASAGSSCILVINGGTNDLGSVEIRRAIPSSQPGLGTEGVVVSNGVVRMTSLTVNRANSFGSMLVTGGTVTNTGSFIVGNQSGANSRQSRFVQLGGVVVSTDTIGVRVGISNSTQVAQFAVLGGTNIAERFVLGDGSNGVAGLTVNFTNAGNIYVGSGGIVSNNVNTLNVALNAGGVFGANANWAGGVGMILAGGAFNCAGLDGAARDISLSGVLRGAGALNKNGPGILTLNAAETYTGNTLVNQGTLALGASGSIGSSPQIIVASGATFEVSAVPGFTLGATRTLGGSGTVTGDVAVASSGIISPGTSPGTLTLANSLSVTGGTVLHFDLPASPGPGNDLLVVSNNVNASGNNTIEVVGGGSPGTVHTLIQYGGSFNGTLANFTLSGATGILSNDAPTKTISLVVQSAIRLPTNVVWVGNATVNDWDAVNRTNWQNAGTGLLDYFVSGDNALFNNAGAAHPIVNLVGNNAPASLTVDATANYTFGGSGSISGAGSLLKTNTGTLTITNLNTFSGGVTIAGGVLEAAVLDIAGSPSSIGAAGTDASKLVLDGGTLRYLGSSVSIDRPATLGLTGGTFDVASGGTALTISGAIGGAGLTKAGPGQLVLTSPNTYTAGTMINNGTLQFNNNTAAGTGGITINAATMRIQGALVLDNVVDFQGNCALEFNGVGGNNTALRGAWVGGGTVNVYFITANASQTFTMGGSGAGGGHQWDFAGTVDFGTNTGFLRINNDNSTFNFGSSNATYNVGTGNAALNQRNGGTTTHLGALIGGPNTKLAGRGNTGTSGTTTYAIGGKNLDTTFEGEINNGSGTTAITKVGTGKLTLTGASIYSGITAVESGILQVDGSFSSSPVTVNGGALIGNGSLAAGVVVNFGATLSPGPSIGQLTISELILQSGSTNVMELNKSAGTNDSIVGLSSVSYSGTLVVSNLGGVLAAGDSFKLFNAANYSGLFEAFVLPALDPRLFWNTNSLLVDGTLKVGTAGITNVTVTGSSISISGSGGPALGNYYVLASTNVVLPLSSWASIATNQFDANGNFSFSATINPAEPQRFYALQLP
jgi:autotransporter-associated beta strand protein